MVNVELQLLATMLQRGDFEALLRGDVTADHFLTNEGKILYTFIKSYRGESGGTAKFPSLAAVKNRFANAAFLIPDPDPGDTVASLVHEVKVQKMKSELRVVAQELLNAAESDDPISAAQKHSATLREMTSVVHPLRETSVRDGVVDMFLRYMDGDLIAHGVPWPWPTLQNHTRGIQRKEFTVIAGRPKSRKTFTALYVIARAALRGHRTCIFTPEMPPQQILMRTVAMMAKIRYHEFKSAQLDEAEFMRFCSLVDARGGEVGGDPDKFMVRLRQTLDDEDIPDGVFPEVHIIQSNNKPVSWIETQVMTHSPEIILVDSFYRHAPDVLRKNADETWRVTSISRGLKDLAMEQNIAVLGTHQINREGNKQIGDLANLALADAIGQDADIILRAVTGKLDGSDVSALVVLGGRELPIDGIIINSVPCIDFTEKSVITDRNKVLELLNQEEKELEKDEKQKADTAKKTFTAIPKPQPNLDDSTAPPAAPEGAEAAPVIVPGRVKPKARSPQGVNRVLAAATRKGKKA